MSNKEIFLIDKILARISRGLSWPSFLRPTNLLVERKKFFTKRFYNPQFRYNLPPLDSLRKKRKLLSKLSIPSSPPYTVLWREKKEELLKKILLLENLGTKNFTRLSINLFGAPQKRLLYKAKKFLPKILTQEKSIVKKKIVFAEEMKKYFEQHLRKYQFPWIVKLTDNISARILLLRSKKIIYIRKDAQFYKGELKRLAYHEIAIHILRLENGDRQPYQILRLGTKTSLATGEGLALIAELIASKNKVLPLSPPARFLARALAVDYALKHSFYQTFSFLENLGFGSYLSWEATVRAKRGITDTSKPGSFTKDHLYFTGMYEVLEYIKTKRDIKPLFIGNIGIGEIKKIPTLPRIKPPRQLPSFYKKIIF